FLLRSGDVGGKLRRLAVQRPVAPADHETGQHEKRRAGDRHLLSDRKGDLLLRGIACADEIDANHRSPAFRSANPTATAPVEASCCASWTPSCCASHAIFLKGLKLRTGA